MLSKNFSRIKFSLIFAVKKFEDKLDDYIDYDYSILSKEGLKTKKTKGFSDRPSRI